MFKLNIYKIKNSKNSIFLLYYIIILFSSVFIRQNSVNCEFGVESWVILSSLEQSIRSKIELVGTPLKDWDIDIYRGVLTGYNEAFIIDSETKEKLIKEDSKSAEIIRPLLRCRDIKMYGYQFADLYLITTFPSLKINIDQYPAVKQHLMDFGYDRLKQTGETGSRKKTNNQWFETQDSISYWEDFYKQKIIWGEISDKSKFALDNEAFFPEATSFLMVGDKLKYILAMLNSRLGEWVFNQIGTTTGVGTNRWKKYTLEKLSVKMPTELEQIHVEQMIDNIIETHSIDEIEKLDKYICQLYKLSQEEVEFIENL